MTKKIILPILVMLISNHLISQAPEPELTVIFDFSPYTRSISNQVVEKVDNSPYPYQTRVIPTISGEVTLLRRHKNLAFGIGVSTFSSHLNFNINFPLPPQFEGDPFTDPNEIYAEFKRTHAGLHGCAIWNKNKVSIGLRLGAYLVMHQNDFEDNYNSFGGVSTSSGYINIINNANGVRHDELSKRITAEIEGLYHISSNFHIGLHLNYLHNRNYFPFYTFYLEQHQEWQPFGFKC